MDVRDEIESRYPLTGVRAATTAPQLDLVERARSILEDDERIVAAWLAGSLATDRADPFSDVDLHCCATDEAFPDLLGNWTELFRRITPLVMLTPFADGPDHVGGYALTRDWAHIDLAIFRGSAINPAEQRGIKPLFDRTRSMLPAHAVPPPLLRGDPYFPSDAVHCSSTRSAISSSWWAAARCFWA